MLTNDNNSLSTIHNKWTDAQRRIVWMLTCKARSGLHIDLDPIVATSFVILQKYFRSNNFTDNDYDLFTLMTAALFAACKQEDSFRPIEMIYNELSKICKAAPSPKVRSILGKRLYQTHIDNNDIVLVTNAEVDLLNAAGFELTFDLPFQYFNQLMNTMKNIIQPAEFCKIQQSLLIDTCLMICSEHYLDVSPEVTAAAAVVDVFKNEKTIPQLLVSWVDQVHKKHGDHIFRLAQDSINEERNKTVTSSNRKTKKVVLPDKNLNTVL